MTKTLAVEWLEITFGEWERFRCSPDLAGLNTNIGSMIRFKSIMDAGDPMNVRKTDYADPERWWL